MKRTIGHWQERTSYYTRDNEGYTEYPELILLSENINQDARVLSISIEDGKVCFNEKCDDNFSIEMEPAEAIEALEQAIEWIREKTYKERAIVRVNGVILKVIEDFKRGDDIDIDGPMIFNDGDIVSVEILPSGDTSTLYF